MVATRTRPAIFVSELHRASAQRGRLDPLFQDLSDHWTRILQRLYPVWALIGPGLSDPGHIEIASRSIYLDSDELLGPRAQIAAGALEARAVLRCFGVALHETFHAKHTKRWAVEHDLALADSSDPCERQLAVDRRLLEEPRMEAHGVREFPAESVRGRFVRRALSAAVVDVILPRFTAQLTHAALAGRPLSRDMAGRASVYLQARTHYGIVEPGVLAPLAAVWRQVLGDRALQALDDLYARLVWIADGELDALDHAARAGLPEADRIAAVCADLGIAPKKAHNLRRQLTLPEAIRARVAERPAGNQLSATLANRLADMHEIAPALTTAVATRITSSELHDGALRDLGAFVHRTLVEDEHAYAVRIDDGALLDTAEQITRARTQLTTADRRQLAGILDCPADRLDAELDALAARARTTACKLRVDGALRERARTGRYAYVHERGADFAAGVWVIDPVFMLDAIREQLEAGDGTVAREQSYFAGARLDDQELRAAGEQDRAQRANVRARQIEATRSNLGLGHDLRAGLLDPTDAQLQALKAIVCHLLARHQRELIAYGAGWSDRERQQPVGDTGRHEPRQADAIADAELQRALADPDPLRAIAGLIARWSAAFVLDPDGVTRTKALGTERMARRLRDALPGGQHPLRTAVWDFLRPMLSPRLVDLHRDAFMLDDRPQSSVDLGAHRGESSLEDLDIGEPAVDAA